MNLLYHENYGVICAATSAKFYLQEVYNQQHLRNADDMQCMTAQFLVDGKMACRDQQVKLSFDDTTVFAETSLEKTVTVNGPDFYTLLPGSTRYATHSMLIGVFRSAISRVTYDICDGTTGELVSHVDIYVATGGVVTTYNLLVSDSGNSFLVSNCIFSKTKNWGTLEDYRDVLESSEVTRAYSW